MKATDPATLIDRITSSLLEQLELQARAAQNLLEHAPPGRRDAVLAELAETRGRLVRLRRGMLGRTTPTLVPAAARARR
jgi:hypothetical protein